jgi:hypothetical protein
MGAWIEGRGRIFPHHRFTAIALALLLAAAPAFAQPTAFDVPRAATLGEPTSTGRGALLMTSQILALVGGATVSVALGSIWIEDHFRNHGRPDPRVIAANVAIGTLVNMALTWVLLPDLARLTNDAGGTVDVAWVRRETMRRTRWIALATALFVGVIGVGAVIEKEDFGRGQMVMAVGAGGALLGVLTFDIVSLLTVRSATNLSRQNAGATP